MTAGDIHRRVKMAIASGDVYDDAIIDYINDAVNFVENEMDLSTMIRTAEVLLSASDREPRRVELPSPYKVIRRIWLDNPSTPLRKLPGAYKMADIGSPSAYYLEGDRFIVFDNIPDQDYTLNVEYVARCPKMVSLQDELALFSDATSLVASQAIILMAAVLHDKKLQLSHMPIRDQSLRAFYRFNEDRLYSGISATPVPSDMEVGNVNFSESADRFGDDSLI